MTSDNESDWDDAYRRSHDELRRFRGELRAGAPQGESDQDFLLRVHDKVLARLAQVKEHWEQSQVRVLSFTTLMLCAA